MTDDVENSIIKYARALSELPFSIGNSPRIIFKHDGRCYMTEKGADFSAIEGSMIKDVTDADQSQFLAERVLIESKDLTAMILCEPPYTGICIESHHEIPAVLDDMAQIVGPAVRIVEPDVKQLAKALTKSTSVMIENGCLVAGGRNLFEAVTAVEIIEKSAETILKAQVIGGVKPLGTRLSQFMHMRYQRSYSKAEMDLQNAELRGEGPETAQAVGAKAAQPDAEAYGVDAAGEESAGPAYSEDEMALRKKLVEFGLKLLKTGLVQGTWGNISVMLDRETMLCTPSGLDYDRLTPEDMVRVNINTLKYEGLHKPTSEKGMHAGIYRKYPDANAIIHTHSKYISIFAAGEMPLQVEHEDKIRKLGEIIGVSRYALAGTGGITRNAIKAMKDAPGCILSHHGMIARGKDLDEAFRNVSLIEDAAREYINKRWEK